MPTAGPNAPAILLVDDDAEICQFLATLLELEGFTPRIATRAEQALASLTGVEAILIDLAMPEVDGFELCRRIRATGFSKPIVIVSARPGVDLPAKAAAAGADEFVRKPFDNADLVARVRRHVRA
ncbi:MAG TPA: response regulator transcription factor [Anaeromyxobacteraceae bacterium]|nr:response regulator transcription factor [Anaeromyxobacteraceae bacterium]